MMTHHVIGLKRSRATVMQVVPSDIPPADGHGQSRPQREHGDHADHKIEQWVPTQYPTAFPAARSTSHLWRMHMPRTAWVRRRSCTAWMCVIVIFFCLAPWTHRLIFLGVYRAKTRS